MNTKAPSFQFYPKDYLEVKVLRMSDAAQGIYVRLLCHIWIGTETQYKIRNDDEMLARILGLSLKKWKKIKEIIQQSDDPCLIEKDGYLVSKRLQKEREKQEKWREKSRKGGLKSAQLRATTLDAKSQPHYQPKGNTSSSSSISSSTSVKKIYKAKSRFKKPTIQEIQNYCQERGNSINPQQFYDFYESKGWMIGKNKMKDWRAAVRTWEKGDKPRFSGWRKNG